MKIKTIDWIKDGGTVVINTDEGTFYIDRRIGSNGKGKLYDEYPDYPEAREIVKKSYRMTIAKALRSHTSESSVALKIAEDIEKI